MSELYGTNYELLIERRRKNQDSLANLLISVSKKKADQNWKSEDHKRLFAYLVGSAYSLWRAAFLTDAKRKWAEILEDAEKLLLRLIRDNAVAYPQERETREWMSGYYLNNARFRLLRANELLNKLLPNRKDPIPIKNLLGLNKKGTTNQVPPLTWEVLQNALNCIFSEMVALNKPAKMPAHDKAPQRPRG